MNQNYDTPRTNAQPWNLDEKCQLVVTTEFARELERELNLTKKKLASESRYLAAALSLFRKHGIEVGSAELIAELENIA